MATRRGRRAPSHLTMYRGAWHLYCAFRDSTGRTVWRREKSPFPTDWQRSVLWAGTRRLEVQKEHEENLRAGRASPALHVLAEQYLTNLRDRGRRTDVQQYMVRAVEREFGADTPADQVTVAKVVAWRTRMLQRKMLPTSVNNYLATLRAMYNVAIDLEQITANPATARRVGRVDVPRNVPPPLTVPQVEAVLAAAQAIESERPAGVPIYGIVVVGYYSLARTRNVAGLRWDEVDFERRALRLRDTKNRRRIKGGDVVVRMRTVLYDYLSTHERTGSLVFDQHATKSYLIHKTWRQALAAANVALGPDAQIPLTYRLFWLRHTGASHLALSGLLSALQITQMMGDLSVETVERTYFGFEEERLADAITRLDARPDDPRNDPNERAEMRVDGPRSLASDRAR